MLRLPLPPQAQATPQPEKYVCPPWLHPIACVTDNRNMVPASVAANGDLAWENVKKSKVWLLALPLPLMILWDYLKAQSEIKLPHQRKKNPKKKIIPRMPKFSDRKLSAISHGREPDFSNMPRNWGAASVTLDNDYPVHVDIPDVDEYETEGAIDYAEGKALFYLGQSFGKRRGNKQKKKNPKVKILGLRNLSHLSDKALQKYMLKQMKTLNLVPDDFTAKGKLTKKGENLLETPRAIKAAHDLEKIVSEVLERAKKIKKKNPAGRCTYQATIGYKRGNKHDRKTLLAEAWNMTEAREKFQSLIDRNLRDATLESLQVSRVTC